MYYEYLVEEWIGLDPKEIGEDLDEAALDKLRGLEGRIDEDLGIIVAVLEAKIVGDGVIPPLGGDPAVYYPVRYRVLAFKPVIQELVKGIVTRVDEFGLVVNLGPVDGKVHRSQIMDENVELMPDKSGFIGVASKREVRVGDIVRARVTHVTKPSRTAQVMGIGLTMRQPYLGKEEWLKPQAAKR
ncbi:MAG: DNA-directed RNA polymerase [Aeropyrum sp.]|nr:DNA-directed RNA polymerase [Aeropyrum sp.]MCE4616224.1 DNA-directed RNA polymerase [Aeropyrum sp.]